MNGTALAASELDSASATLAQYDLLERIPWLRTEVFGNSLHAYILTSVSFFLLWTLFRIIRHHLLTRIDRQVAEGGEKAESWIFGRRLVIELRVYLLPLVAFYAATKRLSMPGSLEKGLHLVTIGAVTIQVVRMLSAAVSFVLTGPLGGPSEDLAVRNTNNNIAVLVKVGLYTAAVLFFLDNAGFNVSTFVTGLGIGGVAIALAAQAVLGDTFSSFAIALDKPFEVGDFINVDNLQGTVEHIGLKTTRVRSVGGELLVFANSDLTRSRIRNFKRMHQRRGSLRINVHPQAPAKLLATVPKLLEELVHRQKGAVLERSHFIGIGDQALLFEVVYSVTSADYVLFLDIQQAISYCVIAEFAQRGIPLAFTAPAPAALSTHPVEP